MRKPGLIRVDYGSFKFWKESDEMKGESNEYTIEYVYATLITEKSDLIRLEINVVRENKNIQVKIIVEPWLIMALSLKRHSWNCLRRNISHLKIHMHLSRTQVPNENCRHFRCFLFPLQQTSLKCTSANVLLPLLSAHFVWFLNWIERLSFHPTHAYFTESISDLLTFSYYELARDE